MYLKSILLFLISFTSLLFCNSAICESSEKTASNDNLVERLNKIDTALSNIEKKNTLIIQQAKSNIETADRILNLQEIIIEFIAVIIAVFGAIGLYAFQRVNKTRKELSSELEKVESRWEKIQNEFNESNKFI